MHKLTMDVLPRSELIMHTKASSSRSGVKYIHVPKQNAQTLSVSVMHSLTELTRKYQITGINLWSECDEEEGVTTFYCEVGDRKYQSTDLACCILEANGMLPVKRCSSCNTTQSLNAFSYEVKSGDGRGNICHTCNRLQAKVAYRKKRRA